MPRLGGDGLISPWFIDLHGLSALLSEYRTVSDWPQLLPEAPLAGRCRHDARGGCTHLLTHSAQVQCFGDFRKSQKSQTMRSCKKFHFLPSWETTLPSICWHLCRQVAGGSPRSASGSGTACQVGAARRDEPVKSKSEELFVVILQGPFHSIATVGFLWIESVAGRSGICSVGWQHTS